MATHTHHLDLQRKAHPPSDDVILSHVMSFVIVKWCVIVCSTRRNMPI